MEMNSTNFFELIKRVEHEENNNNNYLHLTANENIMSPSIQKMISTELGNRYHLGHLSEHLKNEFITNERFSFKGFKELYSLEAMAD